MRRSAESGIDMEQMQRQMQVLADEMNTLKNEFIGIKAAHANMHQASVDAGQLSNTRFNEFGNRWQVSIIYHQLKSKY